MFIVDKLLHILSFCFVVSFLPRKTNNLKFENNVFENKMLENEQKQKLEDFRK